MRRSFQARSNGNTDNYASYAPVAAEGPSYAHSIIERVVTPTMACQAIVFACRNRGAHFKRIAHRRPLEVACLMQLVGAHCFQLERLARPVLMQSPRPQEPACVSGARDAGVGHNALQPAASTTTLQVASPWRAPRSAGLHRSLKLRRCCRLQRPKFNDFQP